MPSLVPDHDTYIVLDDFGALGRAWRETDEAAADRATLIRDILKGQYESPVRIVAFNATRMVPRRDGGDRQRSATAGRWG